jgi:hypothetical protein
MTISKMGNSWQHILKYNKIEARIDFPYTLYPSIFCLLPSYTTSYHYTHTAKTLLKLMNP